MAWLWYELFHVGLPPIKTNETKYRNIAVIIRSLNWLLDHFG